MPKLFVSRLSVCVLRACVGDFQKKKCRCLNKLFEIGFFFFFSFSRDKANPQEGGGKK